MEVADDKRKRRIRNRKHNVEREVSTERVLWKRRRGRLGSNDVVLVLWTTALGIRPLYKSILLFCLLIFKLTLSLRRDPTL